MATAIVGPGTPAGATPGPGTGPVVYVMTLLHNNDGESRLLPAGAYGGAAPFAALVSSLKAQAASEPLPAAADPGAQRGTLMISSGDNFLAGPNFAASLALPAGVLYYDSRLVDLVGYDAMAIGNHEFDFGPEVLARFIGGTTAVPFLSANLDVSPEPALEALRAAGRIAPYTIVTKGGQQIGIIGATTPGLASISTPRNVVVNQVLPAVQSAVTALQSAGVDKIILSSHLQDIANELALVAQLRGVDVVISGGGDELLGSASDPLIPGDTPMADYPRLVNDADGKAVPVVTTAGDFRYVGRLKAGFNASGEIVEIYEPESQPVRVSTLAGDPVAVTPDATVQAAVVQPVQAFTAGLASNVIAQTEAPLDGRNPNPIRRFESNLGNLAADALLWQGRRSAAGIGTAQPDVALQNGGGLRNNNVLGAGAAPGAPRPLTELNTFEVMAFSNFVSIVEDIDPYRLRQLLEHSVSGVPTGGGTTGGGRWGHWAGLRFTWTNLGGAQVTNATTKLVTTQGSRILDVVLADGTVIWEDGLLAPTARNVTLATIDFTARGGDDYPFGGTTLTNAGVSYQQALFNYLTDPAGLGGSVTATAYPNLGQSVPLGDPDLAANPSNRRIVESAAGPTPVIPEAPWAVLLPLGALLALAVVLFAQRRRAMPAA